MLNTVSGCRAKKILPGRPDVKITDIHTHFSEMVINIIIRLIAIVITGRYDALKSACAAVSGLDSHEITDLYVLVLRQARL